jgi:ribonuclease-3
MSSDDEATAITLIEPPHMDKAKLEALVGTKVNNLSLYRRAFTHKSASKKYIVDGSYETLEFMGDSVLGFVITRYLFDKFEKHQEGFLTQARTKIVRGKTLSEIAKCLKLYEWILMDDKGMSKKWNHNPKILEDCLEALIGAIYLDIGMIHAKKFVLDLLNKVNISFSDDDNYKDQLMRWSQAQEKQVKIEYRTDGHHNGTFHITLLIDELECGCGFATTKKQAEQNAAQIALRTMKLQVPKSNAYEKK